MDCIVNPESPTEPDKSYVLCSAQHRQQLIDVLLQHETSEYISSVDLILFARGGLTVCLFAADAAADAVISSFVSSCMSQWLNNVFSNRGDLDV